MSFNADCANPNLRSLRTFNLLFHRASDSFRARDLRLFRRRRPKRRRGASLRCELDSAGDLLRRAPELLAPALGVVSGLAVFASRRLAGTSSERRDIGEWILFASPTPFNRFVLLRCPSVSFEGGELLEGVNERLVREDKHYVRLSTGRVLARPGFDGAVQGSESKLEYQRVCVGTDDGGVVALDWPTNLDLAEEHGLDTTLLVVPGSAQGSMDADIRSFVCEALRRGCFPVVMNPRGCAGSPLTTARLFTAADSDDICTAIQFINNARPWTTLMGVGWGYGANMLTKYLAEVGEATPLTAATCIDNPFDLEEATRSSAHHMAVDQKLTGGLVDILRSNKELFRGRDKGFDVEKALSAKSVRDFEKAISMVSYGFEDVEDFYLISSTRNLIGNVKIPVLFIQNDDGSAPLFSIPRSSIAENPFTSLLLCSCLPSSGPYGSRSAITWCQQLTLEWLTAVELGLLKGRHPLLEDVDITINPSKGLAFVEGKVSNSTTKVTKLLNLTPPSSRRGRTANPTSDVLGQSNPAGSLILRSREDLMTKYEAEDQRIQKVENGALKQTISGEAELVESEDDTSIDTESGEVLQTAQVVMNMLDVTMPGTLTEEKKKKVLAAVDQGETLMKALQDAVPDDVREKLTTAVSGILQSQGTQLKIKELLRVSSIPSVSPGLKSKMEEKPREVSNIEGLPQDHHSPVQTKKDDNGLDGSANNQPGIQMPPRGMETEQLQSESSQKSANSGQSQSLSEGNNNSISARKESNDSKHSDDYDDSLKGKSIVNSENVDKGLETGAKANSSGQAEKTGSSEEAKFEEHKDQSGKPNLSDITEDHNAKPDEKPLPDQSEISTPGAVGETASPSSGSSSEAQSIEKEDIDNQKKENKTTEHAMDQMKPGSDSNQPSFSVARALDALTGLDDSTQVAVNSVFGVLEDMISQLEEGSSNENGVKNEKNASGSYSGNYNATDDQRHENSEAKMGDRHDGSTDSLHLIHHKSGIDSQRNATNRFTENQSTQRPILLHRIDLRSPQERDITTNKRNEARRNTDQLASRNRLDNSNRIKKVDGIPTYVTSYTYGSYYDDDHLRNNLFSEIPTESLDSDATTALLLEYFPEEGQWKLLEQSGLNGTPDDGGGGELVHLGSPAKSDSRDDVIEPLYAILDTEKLPFPVEEFDAEKVGRDDNISMELEKCVKKIVLDDLCIEVGRKLGLNKMEIIDPNLARDLEQVSTAVSKSVGQDAKRALSSDVKCRDINEILEKVGTLNGERIIRAISAAVQESIYLRRMLPIGVIIGSSLAALRKNFNVATVHDDVPALDFDETVNFVEDDISKVEGAETHQMASQNSMQNARLDGPVGKKGGKTQPNNNKNATVMVGAVTAAIGASALLVQNQDLQQTNGAPISLSTSSKMKSGNHKDHGKVEDTMSGKANQNIVASLAEKAMSVASPVVPTTEDGELDQERLVAMLADLGQRGGVLRLIGKVALLWGGIRGAMSLTDRLISFLRIAERPLIQRVLGFASMVLVLWSPIAVPLLPMLVQSWTTKSPFRIAELACIVGLYTAVMRLIMLWGRRIRGYDNPSEQYGLDLTSLPKIRNFLIGLIGGVVLVSSIEAVSALLGCVTFSWPYATTSRDVMTLLKEYGQMLMVVGQGFVTATGVALVEELLFRSWLPEEIAADLGYHRGIIISGLVFSLLQRSPFAIPGLWLLSLSLSGIRQRSQGSLSVVIGMRAGILASSFISRRGGFMTYKPNSPLWITGTCPFQPFSGLTGFAFSLVLALFLYPRPAMQTKHMKKETQE